jgi:choline dehydrogenase-like flavoprotein
MFKKNEIVRSTCEALLRKTENLPLSPTELKDFDKDMEEILKKFPPLFSFFPWLFQISSLFLFRRRGLPLPFTRLSLEERTRYLEKLCSSRFYLRRLLTLPPKFPTLFAFDRRDEVREAIGYQTDCTKETEKTPVPETLESRIIEKESPLNTTYEIDCDVLVVGSGAGGAVVAKELSERGLNVAVIEEGFRYDTTKLSGAPADGLSLYRNFGVVAALDPSPTLVPIAMGKCLGGSTAVNSGNCFRTPDYVLEDWTRAGLEKIGPEEMAPYYEEIERTLSVHPQSLNLTGGANEKMVEGAQALGYENYSITRNILRCRGCGGCNYGCTINAKRGMQITYIPWATQAGATFYTGFKADKIIVKGKRVERIIGTVLKRDTPAKPIGKFSARAKVFVIAAGGIYTPFLLLKSRVANSSGMVGRGLKLHPLAGIIALFPEKVYGASGVSQTHVFTEFFKKERIFAMTGMVAPGAGAPLFAPRLAGKELSELIGNWSKVAIILVKIGDYDADGRVKSYKLPFFDQPAIYYRITKKTKNAMVKGLAEVARIALAGGAEKVLPGIATIPWVKTYEETDRIIASRDRIKANEILWTGFHPLGTCRMSKNPKEGVVDSYGRAHDVENLFVSDASIFPTCVGVPPQITIMALALRCAEYISNQVFKRSRSYAVDYLTS